MAKDLSKIPVTALLNFQQIISFGSREMHDFFNHIEKELTEGKVSRKFRDSLENTLEQKIKKNNKVTDAIEKELFKRVRNTFGFDVTTSSIMSTLVKQYQNELISFKESKKDRKSTLEKVKSFREKGDDSK